MKAVTRKKPAALAPATGRKQIAAGEFKAKCLRAMAEVAESGRPLLVTKRGQPLVEVIPVRNRKNREKREPFLGRLKGVIEIVGDPDDLIRPVFPLEDYDMLK